MCFHIVYLILICLSALKLVFTYTHSDYFASEVRREFGFKCHTPSNLQILSLPVRSDASILVERVLLMDEQPTVSLPQSSIDFVVPETVVPTVEIALSAHHRVHSLHAFNTASSCKSTSGQSDSRMSKRQRKLLKTNGNPVSATKEAAISIGSLVTHRSVNSVILAPTPGLRFGGRPALVQTHFPPSGS